MRPPEFLYNIIDKFSPMQEADRIQLRNEAQTDWRKVRNEIFNEADGSLKEGVNPKELPIKKKLVYWGEHYIVRTILALLFIGCLRWVQDFINPPDEGDDEFMED